jgi:hypothetical protein
MGGSCCAYVRLNRRSSSFLAIAVAGAVAGLFYLDGKLQLSNDLRNFRRVAEGERNFHRAGWCPFSVPSLGTR